MYILTMLAWFGSSLSVFALLGVNVYYAYQACKARKVSDILLYVFLFGAVLGMAAVFAKIALL
jgi:hypothetical protein